MGFNLKTNIKTSYITLLVLLLLVCNDVYNQEFKKVSDLQGEWKFSIGDNSEWSSKDFKDQEWDEILVPSSWENQGFHGYDGYAWYRKYFWIDARYTTMPLYLSLGYIDDVDEVYINGHLIGRTGTFPNDYTTAYDAKRHYRIPKNILYANGENSIAVRVYDEGGEGGIIHGDIAIMVDIDAIPVDYDLQGTWKFKTGDCKVVKNSEWNFSDWDEIIVPGIWENQGYKSYDGIASYAIEFNLSNEFDGVRMVLVLGKIDDLDQVYLNGKLIGQSGEFTKNTLYNNPESHQQRRGYFLPVDALNNKGKNVLIIKVLDAGGLGGLYKGSVGLITQTHYIHYWRARRKR
jgi:sialate O-acetylesterase